MYATIDDVDEAYLQKAGTDAFCGYDQFRQFIPGRYEDVDDETFWDTLPDWLYGGDGMPADWVPESNSDNQFAWPVK